MKDNLFQTLKDEHDKVKEVLRLIQSDIKSGGRQKEELFGRLKSELLPHVEAEERSLYPTLKGIENVEKDVLEAFEEHRLAKIVLDELNKMPKTDMTWDAKISVLGNLVKQHIKDEEEKIFEDARRVLNDGQIQNILKRFLEEKERMMVKVR